MLYSLTSPSGRLQQKYHEKRFEERMFVFLRVVSNIFLSGKYTKNIKSNSKESYYIKNRK